MHRHYISSLSPIDFAIQCCLKDNFPSQIYTWKYFPILFDFSGGQIILPI